MSDLASTQDQATPSAAPVADATTPSTTAQVASVSPDELKALKAELAEARKEAAKYRKRNDEETAQKLKEQGDFKSLYEQAQPHLEKAKRYEAWAEKQMQRIEAEAATLPSYLQKALAIAVDVEAKLEILEDYKAEAAKAQPQAKVAATPPPSGAPAGSPPAELDLIAAAMDPRAFNELKRTQPDRMKQALEGMARKLAPVPSTAWTQQRR